jgi:hypothetical protein
MGQLVKSFVTLDKDSGSGNSTVTVSANSDNTGRNLRSVTTTYSAADCSDVPTTIKQAGKPEFVSFDNATATVAKGGGSVTITGKSNSSKLTFSLGSGGTLNLTLPSTYTANSQSTSNGVAIADDPGAVQEYAFSITFSNIPANTSIDALTKQLIVAPNSGTSATCNISQTAGDATLSVSPSEITLDWNASTTGTTGTFSVTANTTWTVA